MRHSTTTMLPLLPRFTRATWFLLRQRGQSSVGKPFRDGGQTSSSGIAPKNKCGGPDGNALYVIGTPGNEFWATGDWSWTGQGKNGEPIPVKGHWLSTNVR